MRILCSLDGGELDSLSHAFTNKRHSLHFKDESQAVLQNDFLTSARNEFCTLQARSGNSVNVEKLTEQYGIQGEAVTRYRAQVDQLFAAASDGKLSSDESMKAIQLITYTESDFIEQLHSAMVQDRESELMRVLADRQSNPPPKPRQ
ncbi:MULTISPECIES: hypothetical protein [Aeromonas]|uniref:Uncharacterized protein n=1 Tax=Aeromonas caviae TaxID=648 RepID=A0AAJ6CTU4_AERCA|nr:hypothetical protein [Aeromonas caviae]RWT73700.1 hypothetical protein DN604_16555 [Aeromonas caviae]WFG00221.1 hypothetical protein P5S46_22260 [Aeromonas caviae]WVM47850.1 hypothetical protein V0242_24935 [Aeromonas hydrophila]